MINYDFVHFILANYYYFIILKVHFKHQQSIKEHRNANLFLKKRITFFYTFTYTLLENHNGPQSFKSRSHIHWLKR